MGSTFGKINIDTTIKVVEIIGIVEIKIRFYIKSDFIDNSMGFLLYVDLLYNSKYI